MTRRIEKVNSLVQELAAKYIADNSEENFITVSRVETKPDLSKTEIYITVLPEEKERESLSFWQERAKEIRTYLAKNLKIHIIPEVEIQIDLGEKARQMIEGLPK